MEYNALLFIIEFELSRGYKIERAQYVTSLYENCQQGCKSFMAVSDRGKTSLPLRAVEATESELAVIFFNICLLGSNILSATLRWRLFVVCLGEIYVDAHIIHLSLLTSVLNKFSWSLFSTLFKVGNQNFSFQYNFRLNFSPKFLKLVGHQNNFSLPSLLFRNLD